MFRNFDWTCVACGTEREGIVELPQGDPFPEVVLLECHGCSGGVSMQRHERSHLSTFSLASTAQFAPMVSGGEFDTTGNRQLSPMPMAPDGACESLGNYKDWLASTPERKEAREVRKHETAHNRAKQWRAGLIKKGENIDLRTDRLPGDPKNIAS